MELIWVKILALFLILLISITVGLLPLKVRKLLLVLPGSIERSQVFLSSCLCFGAGVLLGTVFLHLLPENLESVSNAQEEGFIVDTDFPIGNLILCSGFFLMYILEEMVHLWVHRNQDITDDHHHVHHRHSHHHNDHEHGNQMPVLPKGNGVAKGTCEHNELEQKHLPALCHNKRRRCISMPSVAVLVGCDNPVICTDSLTNCTHTTVQARLSQDTIISIAKNDLSQNNVQTGDSLSTFRSVLMVMALSIHGCLEGLALGLENSESDVWLLFTALTSHKIAISFSIGMELLEKVIQLKMYILYMAIFSLASPIGGLIGALTFEYSDSDTASGAIAIMLLQGMSGGTILYVVFCEVLERERCKTNGRLARLLALILGFTLMGCLQLIENHNYSHGGGEDDYVHDLDHGHDLGNDTDDLYKLLGPAYTFLPLNNSQL